MNVSLMLIFSGNLLIRNWSIVVAFVFWIKGRDVEVANDPSTRKSDERRKLREKYSLSDRFSPNSKSLRYQYRRIKLCQTFRHNTRLCKELRHILNSAIIWNNLNLLVEETVRVHCNTLKYENKYGRSFLAKIADENYFKNVKEQVIRLQSKVKKYHNIP